MTLGNPGNGKAFPQVNGYSSSNRHSAVYLNNPGWNGSQTNLSPSNREGSVRARYPHIKDLQAKADIAVKNIDPRIPVRDQSHIV